MNESSRNIVVAITGASGSVYAKLLLHKLAGLQLQNQIDSVAVIITDNAREIWLYELGYGFLLPAEFKLYETNNFNAPFASGSSCYDTMIVCPSSMGTMARIATGVSGDLVLRAADVMLKERRRLIVVPRETPFNLIHIRNMETLTLAGAIICPAIPSFYSLPNTITELAATVIDRVLDLAQLQIETYRWNSK